MMNTGNVGVLMDNEDDIMVRTHSVAPAEGERRAITGYYPQYLISASIIIQSLREESLQWIRVADPEAGRVDDLQIGTQSRVDAFQVKWSQYSGNFTFNDLVGSGNIPSLIAQLADGWRRLRNIHSDCRIVVHLVTNEIPSVSVSQKMPVGDLPPTPRHFAAFIEQAWKPAKKELSNPNWSIPELWWPAWETLQKASGLSTEDFRIFVQDCELEFGYHFPRSTRATTRDQKIGQDDLEHLAHVLFATVFDPERIIELSRDQLLAKLGWKDRFEFRSCHEFPEPDFFYQPIEISVRQLEGALSKLTGGYVAVLGTPGSGKSTLLTQTLRFRPERVIKYYAYVPDSQDPMTLRGESVNFLHDMVLALDRAGFRVGETPSSFDRDHLLEHFHQQLQHLHQDWEVNGRKTIILIDGLDHISREQCPDRSLLLDLPLPTQVPDGVYFVLGSQTDQLIELPDRIQHAIHQSDRRIEMEPLNRKAVLQITERVELPMVLTEDQKETVYILSDGHPLALVYILNNLKNAADMEAVQKVFQDTEPYRGDIEAQYHSYWRQIETNFELTHVLGLLARLRGVIDLSWVETWAGHAVTDHLRHKLAHYFRIEDHSRWYFFHYSFRLFLLEKTAESSPGVFDPSRSSAFHHELAKKCAREPSTSYWSWEELYHRILAEEHGVVFELASQRWFRNQFLAFRPVVAIQADIKRTLQSAAARKDPVALTSLVLASTEIAQRELSLESSSLVLLLLHLGEKHTATEHVRDGNRLHINVTAALRICLHLESVGLNKEARRIFELAEPLDLLTARKPIENDLQDEKGTLLEAWAEAAVHFRDTDNIVETIRQIRRGADRHREIDVNTATRSLQSRMLFYAGLELLELQKWEDLSKIMAAFDIKNRNDMNGWFWLQVHAWKDRLAAGDQIRARSFLEAVLEKADTLELGPDALIALAEGVYQISGDKRKALSWFQDAPQPELKTDVYTLHSGMDLFLYRLRYTRLLYAFGDQRSPSDLIPDPDNPMHQGSVYFERAICVIAHIWAEAWRGHQLGSSTIERETFPLLRLFNKGWQETRHWTTWYAVESVRGEFYVWLTKAVAQHGLVAVESLRRAFEEEWRSSETEFYWPPHIRRQIILSLVQVGVARSWAIRKLREIENTMLEGQDVSGRVDECRRQAEAWIELCKKEFARTTLEKMLQVSFGVGYRKDYQLDNWIKWLGYINEVEPEQATERTRWLAQAIVTLEETTERRASKYAANELLTVAFRWSPRRAILLFRWFLDQEIIWHEEAVRILLREALKSTEPPTDLVLHSLIDFLLPISTDMDTELVTLLIEQTAASKGNKKVFETARDILSNVYIYALGSTRPKWRRAIAQTLNKFGLDLSSVGLKPADLLPDPKEESSLDILKLKDNVTELRMDEVKMRASSVSNLQELLDNESNKSYFNWEPVIAHLVGYLDSNDIQTLANLFQDRRHSAQILAILSERLYDLGKIQEAWSLGEKALNASRPYGWDQWYDGGSRLAAFRALTRVDLEKARSLAYETLVRDLTDEIKYPQEVALNLNEILPLLTDNIPIQEIWPLIDEYVHFLFEGCSFPANGLMIGKQLPQDTSARAIADLLMFHLDHPANVVAQAAQRACMKLLLQRDEVMQNAMNENLEGTENSQECILMVLDAVSLQEPDAVTPFCDKVIHLLDSPNYTIQRISHTICNRIGRGLTPTYSQPNPPPKIYRLSFPPNTPEEIAILEEIFPKGPLPKPEDITKIIRAYNLHIIAIAEEVGLPRMNVYYHIYQIMHNLAPPVSWSEQSEEQLRSILSSAGLRLPFRRPRAVLVRRAIFHMIAELMAADMLSSYNLNNLEPVLRFYDPSMMLIEPTKRPSSVHLMNDMLHDRRNSDEWLEQVDEAISSVSFKTSDGLIVLAEETILKCLSWETHTEIRRSVVCLQAAAHLDPRRNTDSFFYEIRNCLLNLYSISCVDMENLPLILRHTAYGFDSPGVNWLALNPSVGYRLGWTISEDGLCKWVNDKDQVMVESIWWVDGLFEQSPPHLDDVVGKGWIVVASQEAWSAIKSQFGTLRHVVNVKRIFYKDGQPCERDICSDQDV